VDNLGAETLAWMASTMQIGGAIASVGLAAGFALNTPVMPFILRGVSLLGIDSVNCLMPVRQEVWRRLATT
jgi:NADPH:quinone reductase-like Zn-dependent oxidoreductase